MTEQTRQVPKEKRRLVETLVEKIQNSPTVMLVSTRGLPASQFQAIKKKLRGKAEITVVKKSITQRAISQIQKGALQNLKSSVTSDTALIFSTLDSFELASLLIDNQTPAKAKIGDKAPEDIVVEAGPTDLMPGPAISELGSVGLKVAVESGKLAIKEKTTIARKGDIFNEKVISVMGKLNVMPMKVGFIPLAAYDARSDAVFTEIRIDKSAALEALRNSIFRSLNFAFNIFYITKETISHLLAKAAREEKAIEKIVEQAPQEKNKEKKNEKI